MCTRIAGEIREHKNLRKTHMERGLMDEVAQVVRWCLSCQPRLRGAEPKHGSAWACLALAFAGRQERVATPSSERGSLLTRLCPAPRTPLQYWRLRTYTRRCLPHGAHTHTHTRTRISATGHPTMDARRRGQGHLRHERRVSRGRNLRGCCGAGLPAPAAAATEGALMRSSPVVALGVWCLACGSHLRVPERGRRVHGARTVVRDTAEQLATRCRLHCPQPLPLLKHKNSKTRRAQRAPTQVPQVHHEWRIQQVHLGGKYNTSHHGFTLV